jgi:hypothetical protein
VEIRPRSLLWGVALCLLVAPASADALQQQAEGQRTQAELQARIEAADDDVREHARGAAPAGARDAPSERAQNAELAPRLERQAERWTGARRLWRPWSETREALPELQRRLVERLAQLGRQRDLPFLREERRARVASLRASMATPSLRPPSAWERIWPPGAPSSTTVASRRLARLPSARESRAARWTSCAWGGGPLLPDSRRPRGRVWQADAGRWAALDEPARREVRHGLRIARDQRAPELLTLPISRPLERIGEGDRENMP